LSARRTARVVKEVKTFRATWRPAGGAIRVVVLREPGGWLAYFCTDPEATAAQVLEAMAARSALEETFRGLKAVWGAGQQQVRNAYANVGAFAAKLALYSAVEAWAWGRSDEGLVDRPAWDGQERRPSHADKRKALQREVLRAEIRAAVRGQAESEEFQNLATRMLDLAA
jgi:hypothetical protein